MRVITECRLTATIQNACERRQFYLSPFGDFVTHAVMEVQSVRELAAVIRSLRREKGWSQAKLASEAGVGREWIIHLEKARPTVELGLVLGTLKALGVGLSLAPLPTTPAAFDLGQILGDAAPPHKP